LECFARARGHGCSHTRDAAAACARSSSSSSCCPRGPQPAPWLLPGSPRSAPAARAWPRVLGVVGRSCSSMFGRTSPAHLASRPCSHRCPFSPSLSSSLKSPTLPQVTDTRERSCAVFFSCANSRLLAGRLWSIDHFSFLFQCACLVWARTHVMKMMRRLVWWCTVVLAAAVLPAGVRSGSTWTCDVVRAKRLALWWCSLKKCEGGWRAFPLRTHLAVVRCVLAPRMRHHSMLLAHASFSHRVSRHRRHVRSSVVFVLVPGTAAMLHWWWRLRHSTRGPPWA
jgi:hypothetical protein